MHFLFFDTETTGIPSRRGAPPSESESWPHIVQLAWLLTDEDERVVERETRLIAPQGFEIPLDATKVHGITTEDARTHGEPLGTALQRFALALAHADLLVAHNISFDLPVLQAEFHRLHGDAGSSVLLRTPEFCTMRSSTDLCRIPSRYGPGFKWPSLDELHRFLFGEGFDAAHDAGADVAACARCFFELRRRGITAGRRPARIAA
ncbi:MAG TPA: 3'-5' exonuclease [Thermoanaerobaculia bacterium]|nr:3'-5' exonuclease [Thermoanaerobaculia bacterium]HQR66862.1 3'-5' exonuclease [Thermoanaerobaculia bacterium]